MKTWKLFCSNACQARTDGRDRAVKDGFARNFLLPRGKALRATKANKERFETRARPARGAQPRAPHRSARPSPTSSTASFVVIRQAGETGVLYGSVSTRDLAEPLRPAASPSNREQFALNAPIKTLGLHPVRCALHPEVEVKVTINVARSPEEAERQARGETSPTARRSNLDELGLEVGAALAEAGAAPRLEFVLIVLDSGPDHRRPAFSRPRDRHRCQARRRGGRTNVGIGSRGMRIRRPSEPATR